MLKDIAADGASADPIGLIDLNGRLGFFADDGGGQALWESDGTMVGTAKGEHLL